MTSESHHSPSTFALFMHELYDLLYFNNSLEEFDGLVMWSPRKRKRFRKRLWSEVEAVKFEPLPQP